MLHIVSNKKSQGISVNVIIIAAIALLVLVVISVVFLVRTGVFSEGLAICHGTCEIPEDECKYPLGVISPEGECLQYKTLDEPGYYEWGRQIFKCCILLEG